MYNIGRVIGHRCSNRVEIYKIIYEPVVLQLTDKRIHTIYDQL